MISSCLSAQHASGVAMVAASQSVGRFSGCQSFAAADPLRVDICVSFRPNSVIIPGVPRSKKKPDIRFLMHTVFLSDIFYKIRIENPIANMDDRSANAAAEQVRVQPAAALGRQHESNVRPRPLGDCHPPLAIRIGRRRAGGKYVVVVVLPPGLRALTSSAIDLVAGAGAGQMGQH